MKYLEAKAAGKGDGGENKMQPGTRPDQFIKKGQLHPDNPIPVKREVQDFAAINGLDLSRVTGTGRTGEITMRDVRDAKVAADKEKEFESK